MLIAEACVSSPLAESRISGDIQNIVFDPSNNPYVVEKDIVVPEGKEIEIPAGIVFLFNSFTGLVIHGHVRVLGTANNPVIFTSIFDSKYNQASTQLPNPFDWNGILVTNTSLGSYFNNFSLSYSVFGIKSQSKNVVIQNGIFRQNGQFHFTIHDQIQFVQDDIPFSYGVKDETTSGASGSSKKKKKEVKGGTTSRQTKIVRFSCLGVGVVGAGLGTFFAVRAAGHNKSLDDMRAAVESSSSPTSKGSQDAWDQTVSDMNKSTAGAIVSYSIGLLGFVGFGISFAF